ncbi:MAG: hypothetical protein ACRCY8_13060 [Dermatophilaceae bacterium]
MEIHPAARKHGVPEDHIRHAVEHAVVHSPGGEDPPRILVLGPDQAGNLLEVVAIVRGEDLLVIHAMAMRGKYRSLISKAPTHRRRRHR